MPTFDSAMSSQSYGGSHEKSLIDEAVHGLVIERDSPKLGWLNRCYPTASALCANAAFAEVVLPLAIITLKRGKSGAVCQHVRI